MPDHLTDYWKLPDREAEIRKMVADDHIKINR